MRLAATLRVIPLVVLAGLATGAGTTAELRIIPPQTIVVAHAEILDPAGVRVASCESAQCASLRTALVATGRYTLALDYLAPDGVREHFASTFSAGFGETAITLRFELDEDQVIRWMRPEITAPSIAGVALRVVGPGKFGELPAIELVNGSKTPIVARSQDDRALIGVSGGAKSHFYTACGTGLGAKVLAPGEAICVGQIAAIGGVQPFERGRYVVTASYGLDLFQELSTDGTRSVSLEVDVDGPVPVAEAVEEPSSLGDFLATLETVVERDPGRPKVDFVPKRTTGTVVPERAPRIPLDTIVAGTLTPAASRRYFRVRVPIEHDRASARFYARCEGGNCVGLVYSVLTEDPRSVSDARGLRRSGGWIRLTDDEDSIPLDRKLYLVVACVDECRKPVHFSGHVYAWRGKVSRATRPR